MKYKLARFLQADEFNFINTTDINLHYLIANIDDKSESSALLVCWINEIRNPSYILLRHALAEHLKERV